MGQWTAERRHRLYNDPESGAFMGSPKAWNGLKLNGEKETMKHRRLSGQCMVAQESGKWIGESLRKRKEA